MHKLIANGTAGPTAAEERLIAVEPLLADRTVPGLDAQQHRFPIAGGVPNTHAAQYSERRRHEARGEKP